MIDIKRINHVDLRVTDLTTTRSFYEKLGSVFLAGPVDPEPAAIMEHSSDVNINFILNANDTEKINLLVDVPEKHTGYAHVALEVDNLDTVKLQLDDLDYTITEGPITIPSGASFLFTRDLDDNVIEFHRPAD